MDAVTNETLDRIEETAREVLKIVRDMRQELVEFTTEIRTAKGEVSREIKELAEINEELKQARDEIREYTAEMHRENESLRRINEALRKARIESEAQEANT